MNNTKSRGSVKWIEHHLLVTIAQALLYASLVASLLSVFLAIFAKQWSDQYTLTDVRGSTIERSQNRQRKLNGITTWHLNTVIRVLPSFLQLSLSFLSYAVSLYLSVVNPSISFLCGAAAATIIYLYLTLIAVTNPNFPYRTSASLAIPYICRTLTHDPQWSRGGVMHFLKGVPRMLIAKCRHLGQAALWVLVAGFTTNGRLPGGPSSPEQDVLDMQCVLWMVQMPLEKDIQLPALEYLATMTQLADFGPALVASCFDVLTDCMKVVNRSVVVTQGLERLATVSAMCCLRTFSRLSVMDPMSGVLVDVRQCYNEALPPEIKFKGSPFYHTLGAIHRLLKSGRERWQRARIEWRGYKPPGHEHAIVARALTELAQSEHRRSEHQKKVPRWIIRFTLHSLSLDPPPSTSVVIDCLSVIAIDLGCEVSSVRTTALSERYDPA